jgi:RNA polymerase sigma-70 factor (ECF subfamily)
MLERQEFLKVFLREERLLAAYLLSATGNVHASEDLLQTVARILWEKLADYDETRPFGAWALGVAHLEVLKWRQQAARSREVLSEDSMRLLSDTAARHAEETDDRYYFLVGCLRELGGTARSVVEMKYGEGRSIREIASCLKKSVAAVEMILVRSRRVLRDCIQRKMSRAASEAP